MFFFKNKTFFRGYEVTGLRRLQGYEIAKSSIYLATTEVIPVHMNRGYSSVVEQSAAVR